MGRAVVVRKEPACGEAAFFAGDVKVNERRFDGPGVQRRRSLFAYAVLDAGICERRTRLAGPPFRPAGCAVARAGVRRPSRGRRPSRPRDGGRTAFPGPAGGGVRPAGLAGVRSGCSPTRSGGGWEDCACKPNLSTWHGVSRGRAGAARPRSGGPADPHAGRGGRIGYSTARVARGPCPARPGQHPAGGARGGSSLPEELGGTRGRSLLNPNDPVQGRVVVFGRLAHGGL